MKLLEYEAKGILIEHNIPTPKGHVVTKDSGPIAPSVLKVQVPVGGRGKAGGIKVVKTTNEYTATMKQLETVKVAGLTPSCIYVEELLAIERELYISLVINNASAAIELVAHPEGGVDIESHDQASFFRAQIDKTSIENVGQAAAEYLDINDKVFIFTDIIEKLYNCFTSEDATLLEINPLAITSRGEIMAVDCKIELDNAAHFRHPKWDFEDSIRPANFVTLNENGRVATIANGAGLAMATVDAIADADLSPANFLDIGGGASEASVLLAFERLMQYPNLNAIVINIFAGITRCDEVAKAIIAAQSKIPNLPPLYIRLSGTNVDIAKRLLHDKKIVLHESLRSCMDAIQSEESI